MNTDKTKPLLIRTTNVRNLRAQAKILSSSISGLFILAAAISRHGDFPEPKLPGHRDPPGPRASVASAASVCSCLSLTLFFSVSLWLCGEYLLVAAMLRCVHRWPIMFCPEVRRGQRRRKSDRPAILIEVQESRERDRISIRYAPLSGGLIPFRAGASRL